MRLLLLILAALWLIPRLLRLLLPRGTGEHRTGAGRFRRDRRPGGGQADSRPERPDRLRDLTQQDISDADYEEIPPED